MNYTHPRQQLRKAIPHIVTALTLTHIGLAQQPAAPTPVPAADEEVIQLSPFAVESSEDSGYKAASTLAGTRLKSSLNDVAASVSVLTKEFLADTAATDLTSFLTYTVSTEASGLGGNFTGANTSEDANLARTERSDARPQFGTRVRGLSAADLTRDYFVTDIPTDSYNVERVEINRGPNSALFGLGAPGGFINSGLKHANPRKTATNLETKYDQYGSLRHVLDHNQVLVRNKIALRLIGLKDDREYRQLTAMRDDQRLTADLVIKPFRNTKITLNGEWGNVKANAPKTLPPIDRITPWFTYGKPSFDASVTNPALNGLTAFQTANTNNNIIGTFGDGTGFHILYNQPNNSSSSVNGGIDGIIPQWNKNYDFDVNTPAFNNWRMLTINTTAQIIRGNPAAFGLNLAQANFYQAMRIMDPSIFNFYVHSVEGPNNDSFQDFRVLNAALEHTFLNNTVGFELAYSKQTYNDGFTTHSSQWNTDSLSVDINTHLPNGAVNPHYGRVYTGGNGYAESYYRGRDAFRATVFGEYDFKKRHSNSWLANLGCHVFTGSFNATHRENHNKTYMNLRTTSDLLIRKGRDDPRNYPAGTSPATIQANLLNQASGELRAGWITYLSPSLSSASSPFGADIPGITVNQNPTQATNALLWNPVTNAFDSGQTQNLFNYTNEADRNPLWTWGNNGTKESVNSTAFILQSFFLKNKLVSTVSWRTDDVTQSAGSAPSIPVVGLVAPPGTPAYSANPNNPIVDDSSQTWSYGLVGHTPDFINKRLPFGFKASALVNKSENFNASAAGRNLYNEALPFPSGETKEYGITLQNEKFFIKITKFETDQIASTVNFPGQTTLWQELANLYEHNTPAEIAASGFQLPSEILTSVDFRPDGSNIWPNGNPKYRLTNPVQANVKETQDFTSKGYELEASYNPTTNWRIAFNLAKVDSITTNTAPYLSDFVERVMVPLWSNPQIGGALYSADRGALNNPDSLFGARSVSLLNQIRSARSRDGAFVTDARRYRANLMTNYDFSNSGALKGWSVGASVRYQSKIAIGYPLREIATGVYGPNVATPFYGPEETNYDAWVGYQRRITSDKVNWSLKFRVRNIGVGDELIPSRANPDGTIYEARIAEPQVWELINTFKF